MEDIRIHTAIHSRYRVFDATGQLPFSIVFGLCRRSPVDTDARAIILHTANSALDVPYAISNGLLTFHEKDEEGEREKKVELANQHKASSSEHGAYLALSSPIGRTKRWREDMTIFQYRIDPGTELASVLHPDKRYTIRLASQDLGVKWWAYNDGDHLSNYETSTAQASETTKLVNSKSSGGHASFYVVRSLPFPSKVEMHMRLSRNEENESDADSANTLVISILNTGSQSIAVQTRGRQRFLFPWGPFQPEEGSDDSQIRIIDSASLAPVSSLQIVDVSTSNVVHEERKPGPCRGLTSSNVDHRPKLETLMTLTPGETLVKRVNIGNLLKGLPDGKYSIHMQPRGAWWIFGDREEIADEGDDRVPQRLYKTIIPPLLLETEDTVELQLENGSIN
ncbi:hypothetical protein E0Z10_g9279 [Xylaria hypoxylon]|uniref:Uncharacterized protein n=1 Tax=Xylaria hypoxylon TaxID=37992 RepID=A0A4Z0YJS4_9PEZI|nr:hypothetical protein E0Z10_g9279 [Xylaria hypoxylon]